ncbi:MAG: Laminin sub domain 2, partial [Thermoleophilia bacterium]|nr:Laminin sub domain 2 [Thermoleophilia bacterium]
GLPNPQQQVGVDVSAPTVAFGATPADGAWVTTATPALTFSGTDDRCLARMQVWIDDATEAGAPTANLTGTATTYTPAALTDGVHPWHVRAVDIVGRSTRTAPADRTVRVDTQDPVSTVTWPTGPTGGTAVSFTGTATDPLKDGSASGIAGWRLRWSANAAGPWTNMVAPSCSGAAGGAFACTWNSTVVPTDGNYFFRLETTDVAGRTWNTTSGATNIDNTAPSLTFNSYNPIGGAASNHWWAGAPSTTLYYRAAASGSVDVRFNAADVNGVALAYPTLGGGFTAGGAGVGPTPFSFTYGFTPGAPVTATQTVTATDGAGRTNTATFRVESDDQPPVGATIDYLDGYLGGPVPPSPANAITFNRGIDFGGAGTGPNRSDLESWIIQREEGDLVAGGCVWGATSWLTAPAFTNPAVSPVADPLPAANDKCYQYRIVVTDHVGNQTITTATTPKATKTDWTPPAPFDLQPPTNPALPAITTAAVTPGCTAIATYPTATPTLGWTTAADSALAEYRMYFDPSPAFPLAYTSVAAPTTSSVLAARPAGLYWWKVAARDVPNNLTWNSPGLPNPQLQVGIDVVAPAASLTAPANNAWSTSANPTLSWSATDDRCAARTQVWIDNAAEAGVPAAVTSGTEAAFTPMPLTDGSHTWHVRAIDVADRRTSTADRTIRIDTLDPVATATWPTGPTGGAAVPFSGTATDPLRDGNASGVASWRLRWAANVAGPWTTMVDPGCTGATAGPITCSWNSNVVPTDGNYYFQLDVTDNAGRTHAVTSGATNIDNTPPAISFNSFSPAGGAAANFWTPGGASSTLYYNPAASGTVAVRFNASDFNGITGVAYPAIGGGFTAGGAGVGPTPYSFSYTFVAGAAVTANHTVTATDGAGRPNTATFRTEADTDAPVGASISYTDGYYGLIPPNPQPPITFNRGTDFGGAGIGPNRSDIESWIIQREEGDLVAGSCVWGATSWVVTATNPAASPVADSLPLVTDRCYQYRIVVTDHVG